MASIARTGEPRVRPLSKVTGVLACFSAKALNSVVSPYLSTFNFQLSTKLSQFLPKFRILFGQSLPPIQSGFPRITT